MSRDLTAGMVTEVTASELIPIMLAQAELDSGDINFWTGYGSLVYNGDTFNGAGNLLGISEITETQNTEAKNVSITLNGIDSSILSIVLTEPYQDRPIKIWFAALNSAGVLISDPYLMFRGRLDTMAISDGGSTATIGVNCENNLVTLTRSKERRYTAEDQKVDYPTDTGFDYVTSLQDTEIVWGRT